MILSVSEPSISFSCVTWLYNSNSIYDYFITDVMSLLCFVTYMTIIYNITLYFSSKSKKKKNKIKPKNQMKERK